jgi:hypothetical protein
MEIGRWVRASGFVGIVSAVEDDGTVVVFNPGDRQMLRATPGTLQPLPTGTVEVRVGVQVQVPHGLSEEALRRWVAAMLDPVLRERARDSLTDQGLDPAAVMLEPTWEVTEVTP